MKYKKRPEYIEAYQYDGDLNRYRCSIPKWIFNALDYQTLFFENGQELFVRTPEETYRVNIGDYIIRWNNGDLFLFDPDTFKIVYEPVGEKI